MVNAWLEHCKDCLHVIDNVGFQPEDRLRLIGATKSRLFMMVSQLRYGPDPTDLCENEKDSLEKALLESE
jgi:hypothetical protein